MCDWHRQCVRRAHDTDAMLTCMLRGELAPLLLCVTETLMAAAWRRGVHLCVPTTCVLRGKAPRTCVRCDVYATMCVVCVGGGVHTNTGHT